MSTFINIVNYNEIILQTLSKFYNNINPKTNKQYIEDILPILTGNTRLSIRLIDWFVTNYSKKNNIVYSLEETNNTISKYFNVYTNYKAQLKGYKKKLFDPFCRKRRIPFYYGDNKCLITTIGQLNFFKWALEYKILEYLENNYNIINIDMNNTIKLKQLLDKTITENNSSSSINCINMKVILDIN